MSTLLSKDATEEGTVRSSSSQTEKNTSAPAGSVSAVKARLSPAVNCSVVFVICTEVASTPSPFEENSSTVRTHTPQLSMLPFASISRRTHCTSEGIVSLSIFTMPQPSDPTEEPLDAV